MEPAIAEKPTCAVLHRIEGSYFTDILVKGFPDALTASELADGRFCRVYESAWPTKWIVRVYKPYERQANAM